MTRSAYIVMLSLLVTVSLLAAAGPAQALAAQQARQPPSERCVNGAAGTNCNYCSYNGSGSASLWQKCEDDEDGYYWTHCTVWTGSRCVANAYTAFDATYLALLA